MIKAERGTKDVFDEQMLKFEKIERAGREVFASANVQKISTPIFEVTELFARGVGDSTDIVNKEMYTFKIHEGNSLTLRPENTAGVVRAYIEHGFSRISPPQKFWYFGPMFRYERPQAGRLREFHQYGVEFLGSDKLDIDAEAIILAKTLFDKLGVSGLTLYINSIGCKNCRAEYEKALKEYLNKNIDGLCELCKDRLVKNPLRIFDCKNLDCKKIVKNAPKILDYICEDCSTHFAKVKSLLEKAGVEYRVDAEIVRGLDYYTKTVFEFVSTNIGAQGTVCGGGRYDKLIEELGGPNTPGIGFAMGIERLILLMESVGVGFGEQDLVKVYIAGMGEEEKDLAFTLANSLRIKGIKAEVDHMGRGIKAQFKYADKIGAKLVAVIGSDEMANGVIKVKNMEDGNEQTVKVSEFIEYVVRA